MNFDRVCVDASLALAWLIPREENPQADALRREWREHGVEMIGPPMFRAETTSVLREEVFFKRMRLEEGEEALALYSSIPIRIVNSPEIYYTAWHLAADYNQHRAYDMQYLAVAELEDCELWTADRRLVNVVRGKNKRVKWLGDYQKRN